MSRRRDLSDQEHAEWLHAMRDTKRQRSVPAAAPAEAAPGSAAVSLPPAAASPPSSAATAPAPATAGLARPPGPPALAAFERRLLRHLARGARPIDARLDLHGMRQQEAYDTLLSFLHRQHAQGARHVLVITGKGARAEAEDTRQFWEAPQGRGVLRRSVPLWLAEPRFRALVVSYTAAAGHGGDGALYLKLRRRA